MPRQLLIFKACCCPKKGLSFNLQPGRNCIDLCRVFFVLKGQKMGDSKLWRIGCVFWQLESIKNLNFEVVYSVLIATFSTGFHIESHNHQGSQQKLGTIFKNKVFKKLEQSKSLNIKKRLSHINIPLQKWFLNKLIWLTKIT